MTRPRHFIFTGSPIAICAAVAVVVATATFASAGCKSQSSSDAEAEADRQVAELRKHSKWDEQATGVKPEPVMVTQGPTPLVYLFDIGGSIRVIDLTSKSQLAAATVGDHTLVRIDDRKGVTAGDTNLMPGPLPAGHNYGIYLDPSTPNVMRQGIGPPGDVPR